MKMNSARHSSDASRPQTHTSPRSRLKIFFRAAIAAVAVQCATVAWAQTSTTLHAFTGGTADGTFISADLVQASDGVLYGVTSGGGANNNGIVFGVQPDGSGYQVFFSFPAGTNVTRAPISGFMQGRDGALYGTTSVGGSANVGSLYKVNPDGSGFTVLHSFGANDGINPRAGLLQATDGILYGATTFGSATPGQGSGTIYRIAPDGSGYRVIFSFDGAPAYLNGIEPTSLIQGRDGALYGTTKNGGANATQFTSPGTVFRIQTDGTGFAIIHSFLPTSTRPSPYDGALPDSPLIHAADGFLYGASRSGGQTLDGCVFRMRTDGSAFEVIYSFLRAAPANGTEPKDAFFMGSDGALYGRTISGGTNNNGVIYKLRPDGTGFKVVANNPGFASYNALMQGRDGALYGAASGGTPTVNQLFRLVEALGPVITQQPSSQTIAPGGSVTFSVTATGATSYQWRRDGTAIAGATAATLTLNNLTAASNATYTVVAANSDGSTPSAGAVLLVAAPIPGRLINLSVRTTAGTGAQTLIAGFVVGGTGVKQVLTRAIGPTLGLFGVTGVLTDPQLALFNASSVQIGANSGWSGTVSLTQAMTQVGAFALPVTSRDAALLSNLPAGTYSAQASSSSGATGVVLIEAYDADALTPTSRFINLSARTVAGTGAQTLIAGFVLSGNVPRTMLIRGVGPGLNQFGLTGTLANPRLELHTTVNNVDTVVASNTGWAGAPALSAAFTQVGAFSLPATSADAALLVSLTPGAYSAQITGANNTTGVALVEIYEVP